MNKKIYILLFILNIATISIAQDCRTLNECADPTPICNYDDGSCVECVYDTQCSDNNICDPVNNVCLGCLDDGNCDQQVCDTDTNTCHDCFPECTDGQVCNTEDNSCVECVGDQNCSDGQICDLGTNTCINCNDNSDCSDPTGICKLSAEPPICVECLYTSNCDVGWLCDTDTNECYDCQGCTEVQVCKIETHQCVECLADTDCENLNQGTPKCQESDNTCYECLETSDCGEDQVCDNNVCYDCVSDTDCQQDQGYLCVAETNTCEICGGLCDLEFCRISDQTCQTCLISDQCTDPGSPVCKDDIDTHACVQCTDSEHCSEVEGSNYCDLSDNLCYECVVDNDCGPSQHVCENHQCYDCNQDGHCEEDGFLCKTDTKECLECGGACDSALCRLSDATCQTCLINDQCTDAGTPVCKTGIETHECVKCTDDGHCNEEGSGYCDPSDNLCYECVDGTDCDGQFVCENHLCYDCSENSHCLDEGFLCKIDTKECLECGGECDVEFCRMSDATCQECLSNDQCNDPGLTLCYSSSDDTNACVECLEDTDCTNSLCYSFECTPCGEGCNEGYVCTDDGVTCGECNDNTDCTNNYPDTPVCDTSNNTCQICVVDGDCEEHEVCNDEQECVDGSVGLPCRNDSFCYDNLVCNTDEPIDDYEGTCQHCQNDSDCNQEQSFMVCNDQYICVAGSFNSNCDDDSECLDQYECDTEQKLCKECYTDEFCGEEQVCSNNTCYDGSFEADCTESQLCYGSYYCFDNECKECQTNDDCDSENNEVCFNKLCKDGQDGASCADNDHNQCINSCLPNNVCGCDNSDELLGCADSELVCTNSNLCKDGTLGQSCSSDDECGSFCHEEQNVCAECLLDEECSEGQICTDYFTCKNGNDGQTCSDNDSECENHCDVDTCKQCILDEHCGENEKCNDIDFTCADGQIGSSCQNNSYCIDNCLTDSNICVECLSDDDCSENNVCNDSNTCVDGSIGSNCTDNSDCQDLCETESGLCVACLQNDDCDTSNNELCNNTFECVDGSLGTSCVDDSECLNRCEVESQTCVICVEESDCPIKQEVCSSQNVCKNGSVGQSCDENSDCLNVCDTNNSVCTVCLNDNDCDLLCNTAEDSLNNTCVECRDDSHCDIGSCFENSCLPDCTSDDDCQTVEQPVCNESKVCTACQQSTDCFKFTDAQICDPSSKVCIAQLNIEEDCCDQPVDMVTNSDPEIVEQFLEDSPVITLVFEIQTEAYKQKLYFVQLLVNGEIAQPQSVDNSVLGKLTINLDSSQQNFTKGDSQNVKVYASYDAQQTRRVLANTQNLIKFEKTIQVTDKESLQQEPEVKTVVETKEETNYLYLYILIPVAVVLSICIGFVAFKGGQKKQYIDTVRQEKIKKKQEKQYVDTENLNLKDD